MVKVPVLVCLVGLLLVVVGCSPTSSDVPAAPPTAAASTSAQAGADPLPMHQAPCPVTIQRVNTTTHAPLTSSPYFFGNDNLWAFVNAPERLEAAAHQIQPDGSTLMKWPWYYKDALEGPLSVRGTLLHQGDQHGQTYELGKDIHATTSPNIPPGITVSVSYMVFPQEGCWEVTAMKGEETIRFVTNVVYPK